MLKECAMDPNETAQKLLFQDTFHEVKRKRDKKKENIREVADSRWKSGVSGRGGRSGRGGYPPRFVSNDAGGGRIVGAGKENAVTPGTNKGNVSSSSLPSPNFENKIPTSISSSVAVVANGPTKADQPISPQECTTHVTGVVDITSSEKSSGCEINGEGSFLLTSVDANISSALGKSSKAPLSISGVYASASDPILVPSIDARAPGAVGAIKRQVGSQRVVVETTANRVASRVVVGSEPLPLGGKLSPQLISTSVHGKTQSKSQLFEGKQLSDTSHAVPSSSVNGSASRPSSNYSNRSQQLSGSHKVGTSKEWKPKSAHASSSQPSATHGNFNATPIQAQAADRSLSASSSVASDIITSQLENKLEDLQLSETQHVIIPPHLQVPESERQGLSFGSFDASFKLAKSLSGCPAVEDSSTPPSELSQEGEENLEEGSSSIHNESPTAHEAYSPDHLQSPVHMPDVGSSGEADVPSEVPPQFNQSKPDELPASEGSQYSAVHTIPTYSTFGLAPQMLGSQFTAVESTEPQVRDATRVPNFVSGNPVVLSSAGPTPLVTQAAGAMQSPLAVTQQPVSVFRQPSGVHLSHFPPNYIPYNQYFPPYYVPPPALHHFLSNAAFPQPAPTGSIYPPAATAAGAPVKYPISQYKAGTNTGHSNHVGLPAYTTYNSNPAGYGSIPAAAGGHSTGPDELTGSQYKENNVYITGQQSEGSAVWIPASGRDMSGMQINSFYGLSPQAQHMAFAPTQPGHGALGGMYHPAQTVAAAGVHPLLQQSQTMAGAVEVAGPYQQPQRGQINWANNY